MEKIDSFTFVIDYLKEGQVLTTVKHDLFVYKKERVYRYFNGSSYSLTLDEFIELYKKETFYVYEDNTSGIDQDKDEAYYRYYKK